MTEKRASTQDIRPLKIAIVNLMPTKEVTETQLLRLLGNTPLQIEISLVRMENHQSKNTDDSYLDKFYIPSSEVFKHKFDGMIITGGVIVMTQHLALGIGQFRALVFITACPEAGLLCAVSPYILVKENIYEK